MKIFISTPALLKRLSGAQFKESLILMTILDQATRAYISHSYPDAIIDDTCTTFGATEIVVVEGLTAPQQIAIQADVIGYMTHLYQHLVSIPTAL